MPPHVCIESAETLDGALIWFLFFPIIHSRLLQVAMILLIVAELPSSASRGSREAAGQCASTAAVLQGGRVFCDLTMAAAPLFRW